MFSRRFFSVSRSSWEFTSYSCILSREQWLLFPPVTKARPSYSCRHWHCIFFTAASSVQLRAVSEEGLGPDSSKRPVAWEALPHPALRSSSIWGVLPTKPSSWSGSLVSFIPQGGKHSLLPDWRIHPFCMWCQPTDVPLKHPPPHFPLVLFCFLTSFF